jgi:hypothetical protein
MPGSPGTWEELRRLVGDSRGFDDADRRVVPSASPGDVEQVKQLFAAIGGQSSWCGLHCDFGVGFDELLFAARDLQAGVSALVRRLETITEEELKL